MPFIAKYLVSSFGFSPERALRVSTITARRLASIKTREQPDSVISFLGELGLSDSQIRRLILFSPAMLAHRVDRSFKPRARKLMDAGFGGKILVQLIQSNPQCLFLKGSLARLQFWRRFANNREEVLLKLLTDHVGP